MRRMLAALPLMMLGACAPSIEAAGPLARSLPPVGAIVPTPQALPPVDAGLAWSVVAAQNRAVAAENGRRLESAARAYEALRKRFGGVGQ